MINIKPRQRSHPVKVCMTINDLVGDNLPGFVWKLQDQISQAARKYEGVLIGACTSFHHQTFFISVVEGCLGGRFVVVAWERLGFEVIQGRHVAVQEGDINMDQGVFNLSMFSNGGILKDCGGLLGNSPLG